MCFSPSIYIMVLSISREQESYFSPYICTIATVIDLLQQFNKQEVNTVLNFRHNILCFAHFRQQKKLQTKQQQNCWVESANDSVTVKTHLLHFWMNHLESFEWTTFSFFFIFQCSFKTKTNISITIYTMLNFKLYMIFWGTIS